ncbi:amidase [Streptomyces smyrnaeus]|uniref:amidase n=1 Tax=Streptomyces TaxID=1883 RepID=UPI000C18C2E2|nr:MULTISPECIES: amidase [unclassified Streptomyces]MBQ0867546.1 amidase [Streptomyces sp. RK75]MBQ1123195.1 amidase [Streptomyces sp. B15]
MSTGTGTGSAEQPRAGGSGAREPLPGLARAADLLAAGEVTSRALAERALARIEATQPTLNAFRLLRTEAALAEADAADRALARGERRPLLGVPVAVKDDTDVCGEPTAFGCAGAFPLKTADAEVVRRLRAAGAVVVGKTNSPELGQWPFTEGSAFGETRNPWSLAHTPGGSSGGAAAAVAAGLVPAALGSDGAGSVRIPAAWTHLVGIKPQRGRISTWPDPEAFNGITVFGPLARTVEDAALLLDAAAGNREGDLHRPPPVDARAAVGRDPGRLRIALSTRWAFTATPKQLDPRVEAAVRTLAERLAALGHEVEEADPHYGPIGLTFVPRATAGVRTWVRRTPDPGLLDPRTRATARTGRLLGGPVLRAARAAEGPLRRHVGRIFRRYDLVLTPTTATPPPRIGDLARLSGWQTDRRMIAHCPYAWPWNVLGWPGINVPAALTEPDRLPLGAQFLGPAHSEPLLVRLAAQLEADQRWHERWPPLL